MHFPTLTTKRLTLRQLDDNDCNAIFSLRSDDAVNKYIDREKARDIGHAKAFIKKINAAISEGGSFYWAICFSGNKDLTGTICLWNFSEDGTTAEVGYELMPIYQKQGIMNEALQRVIRYSFAEIKLKTLLAYSHKNNIGSLRLLEKNNFKIDHTRKDEYSPDNIVCILTNEGFIKEKNIGK